MKRRQFIKTSAKVGLVAGTSLLTPWSSLLANPATQNSYDLVAIKNSTPDKMFDAGIQALGGMKSFVKKGQTVVVKPNIAWDTEPDRAANTHPLLVQRITEHCIEAGARKVYVFDHTCNSWRKTYKKSGIEAAVKHAGGTMVPGNREKDFHPVRVAGKRLDGAQEHELILESDVFINVPVLKSHGSASITVSMKNLMGIVWDRSHWHSNDLHQCIADFACYRKPDLNVVDAYNVMMQNGPRGISTDDVVNMKTQLISTDMVTADTAAAKLFGINPDDVEYIQYAAKQGGGRKDLGNLAIKRITL